MTFISHAQNFEDIRLHLALRDVQDGRYLDIGAQDPGHLSVSQAFHDLGWTGVHVEPVPAYADMLRTSRAGDRVIQAIVGQSSDGSADFHIFDGTGLSTRDADLARRQGRTHTPRTARVKVIPLSDLLADETPFHWMKIDVEGAEGDVLRSWGDAPGRPWILCIEAVDPLTQSPNHADWEDEILSRGYDFTYFDGLNRFYVHASQSARATDFGRAIDIFDNIEFGAGSGFTGQLDAELAHLRKAYATTMTDQAALQADFEDVSRRLDAQAAQALNVSKENASLVKRLDAAALRTVEISKDYDALVASVREAESQPRPDPADHEARADLENALTATQADLESARSRIAYLEALDQIRRDGEEALLQDFVTRIEADKLSVLQSQSAHFENERIHFGKTVEMLDADRAALIAQVESVQTEAQALKASTSWRLTKPLRAGLSAVRGGPASKPVPKASNLKGRLMDRALFTWRQDFQVLRPVRAFINKRGDLAGRLSGLAAARDAKTDFAPLIETKKGRAVLKGAADAQSDWLKRLPGRGA